MKKTRHRHSTGLCHKSGKSVRFYFDHKPYYGASGDTVETALMANGIFCFGYSHNYRQPMGNNSAHTFKGVVNISQKNIPSFTAPASDVALSENMNILSCNPQGLFSGIKSFSLSNFFSENIKSYKQHYTENKQNFLNYSVGKALSPLLEASTEKKLHHPDIHIIGGGISGLYAALICVMSGLHVIISEKKPEIFHSETQNSSFSNMSKALLETVLNHPLVTILTNTTIVPLKNGADDIVGVETDIALNPDKSGSYHTNIHIIKAKKTFIATGIKEQEFFFTGSHLGGIFTAETYNDYHHLFGINGEKNIVLYINNDKAYDVLQSAHLSPKQVNGIIDQRSVITETMQSAIDNGYTLYNNAFVTQLQGKDHPQIITFQVNEAQKQNANPKNIECEILIQSAGHQLDLNLYFNKMLEINVNCTNAEKQPLILDAISLDKSVHIIGYGTGEMDYSGLLKETYNIVRQSLEESRLVVDFPETMSEHLHKVKHVVPYQHINNIDKRLYDKTFFPHDIRYIDYYDSVIKSDDIIDVLNYFTDKNIIYHDQNIIFWTISEYAKESNLSEEEKYHLFLKTIQTLYKNSSQCSFTDYIDTISLIGHVYPALYATYRQLNIQVSTAQRQILPRMVYEDPPHREKMTASYNNLKQDYGLRDLSFAAGPFVLTGPDAALLLEEALNISVIDLPIGKNRSIQITTANNKLIEIILSHSHLNHFIITSTDCSHNVLKDTLEKFINHGHLKYALSDQSEQINMIQILGKNAINAISFLGLPIEESSFKKNDFINGWFKNIEIQIICKQEFGLQSLICMMPSDAIADIFPRFFQDIQCIANKLFDQKMIDILALENSDVAYFSDHPLQKTYPYIMYASPLSSSDKLTKDTLLFETRDNNNPIGVIIKTCYSPMIGKYISCALLAIKSEEIRDKVIIAHHEASDIECNVKILSPDSIAEQERIYD